MSNRSIQAATLVMVLLNLPVIIWNRSALMELISAASPALIQIGLALAATAVLAAVAVLCRNYFVRNAE